MSWLMAMMLAGMVSGQASAPDYRDGANWLCRPGREDACSQDLTATVIGPDGTEIVEPFKPAADAGFDCFYVYPTVSFDPGGNSDLVAGDEERRVIQLQAARFGSVCKVYAPLYRQVTLTALRAMLGGQSPAIDRDLAYADVRAAWNDYLAHDNHGRGVVLIGHSQGSLVLTQLLKREIEGKPAADRLISAMLIGSTVPVPEGKDVGALYQSIPLCRSGDQTGCIVTYASFRADYPPPADSRFGRGDRAGTAAGCTNPAALAGGKGELHPYFATASNLISVTPPRAWVTGKPPATTPFVRVPGLVSAECRTTDGATYLAITINADPADPRSDDIDGDILIGSNVLRSWGLHLVDMSLAMGDLIALADRQAKAWAAKHPG